MLRKVVDPSKGNDSWRSKTNQELNKLINHKNIANYLRARRHSWLGHIKRMPPNRSVKSLYTWKPLDARPVGRPETRWKDDV
jgi:hypothetical protein